MIIIAYKFNTGQVEDLKETIEKHGKGETRETRDLTKMTFCHNFKHFTISSWFISYQIPSLSVQWFLLFKFYQRKVALILFLLRYLYDAPSILLFLSSAQEAFLISKDWNHLKPLGFYIHSSLSTRCCHWHPYDSLL